MLGVIPKEETFRIPGLNPINIKGHSRSAKRTGYILMPYNIVLDAGYCFEKPSNLTLVSHGHHDHIAGLYQLLRESTDRLVMIPPSIEKEVSNFLNSSFKLDGGTSNTFKWNPIITPNYKTKINGKDIYINTYKLDHRVETIGFGIIEIKKKLREAYKDKSGKELGELIKKKVDVKYEVPVPILLFISDTSNTPLHYLPFDSYKLVIIECTFLLEKDYEDAQIKKHIHWFDLKQYVEINPNTHFILGHFSARYTDDFLKEKEITLKKIYSNITFWI